MERRYYLLEKNGKYTIKRTDSETLYCLNSNVVTSKIKLSNFIKELEKIKLDMGDYLQKILKDYILIDKEIMDYAIEHNFSNLNIYQELENIIHERCHNLETGDNYCIFMNNTPTLGILTSTSKDYNEFFTNNSPYTIMYPKHKLIFKWDESKIKLFEKYFMIDKYHNQRYAINTKCQFFKFYLSNLSLIDKFTIKYTKDNG